MTQKDYVRTAELLEECMPLNDLDESYNAEYIQWQNTVENLAHGYEQDNPKFNKTKFLQACGIETE